MGMSSGHEARVRAEGLSMSTSPHQRVWSCKIGFAGDSRVGSDKTMRAAVERAYRELTGRHAEFCFSGWGGGLTDGEAEIVSVLGKKEAPA